MFTYGKLKQKVYGKNKVNQNWLHIATNLFKNFYNNFAIFIVVFEDMQHNFINI